MNIWNCPAQEAKTVTEHLPDLQVESVQEKEKRQLLRKPLPPERLPRLLPERNTVLPETAASVREA